MQGTSLEMAWASWSQSLMMLWICSKKPPFGLFSGRRQGGSETDISDPDFKSGRFFLLASKDAKVHPS
jgi:hypothetical protein